MFTSLQHNNLIQFHAGTTFMPELSGAIWIPSYLMFSNIVSAFLLMPSLTLARLPLCHPQLRFHALDEESMNSPAEQF
jgi:hypothetical protein